MRKMARTKSSVFIEKRMPRASLPVDDPLATDQLQELPERVANARADFACAHVGEAFCNGWADFPAVSGGDPPP